MNFTPTHTIIEVPPYGDTEVVQNCDLAAAVAEGAKAVQPAVEIASYSHGNWTAEDLAVQIGTEAAACVMIPLFMLLTGLPLSWLANRVDYNEALRQALAEDGVPFTLDWDRENWTPDQQRVFADIDQLEFVFSWEQEMVGAAEAVGFIIENNGEVGMTWIYQPLTDWYGRIWPFAAEELCRACGQPDSCGDCNHQPLTDAEAQLLLEDA